MSQLVADSLVSEGDELFRTERFGEAAARFERAISVFPHHALGWRGLGRALLCMGKPHEAARAFDQAIGLRPDSATALWGGALAHAEIGNKIVARDYLRRSIALQPSWVELAASTPQLADYLQVSARASDRLHALLGPFSTRRYRHVADSARFIEVARLAGVPTLGVYTFVTIGLSNVVWTDAERPRVELIMAASIDDEVCARILANLAFHLGDTCFFPEPGTIVRDVVTAAGAGASEPAAGAGAHHAVGLGERLPHVYVQSPHAWGFELPLDDGPPAITLAQAFPISEAEYQSWRELGSPEFERLLFERKVDVTDLHRA